MPYPNYRDSASSSPASEMTTDHQRPSISALLHLVRRRWSANTFVCLFLVLIATAGLVIGEWAGLAPTIVQANQTRAVVYQAAQKPLTVGAYTLSSTFSRSGDSASMTLSGQGRSLNFDLDLASFSPTLTHTSVSRSSAYQPMDFKQPQNLSVPASVNGYPHYTSWWDAYWTCFNWPFSTVIQHMSAILGALGGLAAGIYTLLGITLPAWVVWLGIAAAAAFLGLAAFCTGYANAWWWFGMH